MRTGSSLYTGIRIAVRVGSRSSTGGGPRRRRHNSRKKPTTDWLNATLIHRKFIPNSTRNSHCSPVGPTDETTWYIS